MGNLGYYFSPADENELVEHIIMFLEENIDPPEFKYSERLNLFGEKFMDVVTEINSKWIMIALNCEDQDSDFNLYSWRYYGD